MKTAAIPFKIFFAAAIFCTLTARSQQERTVYAVTDSVINGSKWNFLRKVDLRTKNYSGVLLRLLYGNDTLPVNSLCNGVAAIAHDKRSRRVYFTPMLIDRLSYVDLRTMQIHTVTNNFSGSGPKKTDQSNIITRMTFADNGFGYALTNDGRQLIRFSTRNNPSVMNLGSLIDAPGNEVSVHSACESFGGDIIADDEGNLWLITITNGVFKINIRSKIARYKGRVRELPEGFSTNGAAVNERESRIILASATSTTDLYSFNIHSLRARELNIMNPALTADLAGSNILGTRNHEHDHDGHESRQDLLVNTGITENDIIQLFPNPVTNNEFTVDFKNAEAGSYIVDMIGVNGKTVVSKIVNTSGKSSLVNMQVPAQTARGVYAVRISDKKGQVIFSGKIILQ